MNETTPQEEVVTWMRRVAALGVVVVLAATGCSAEEKDDSPSASSQACDIPEEADLSTADGWLSYFAQHLDDVSLVIEDDTGNRVEHRGAEVRPAASSIKVVHLLAYARAVHDGELDPQEEVGVEEWERYYYPADGGAHAAALERLEIAAVDHGNGIALAEDRSARVTVEELVTAMIRESDNAAADYLRHTLGDQAIVAAADDAGMSQTTVTSLLSTVLGAGYPDLAGEDPDDVAERYLNDEAWATERLQTAEGGYAAQAEYLAAHGPELTAADLAEAYSRIADDSLGEVGQIAQEHLEWQGAAPSGTVIGFKAGSLPGMVTGGFEIREEDGTTATAVLLIANMAEHDYNEAVTHGAWQQLIVGATSDDTLRDRLDCVIEQ
ncbi:MAG TPA: class A beta-lactamase-related serine hydrolase [Candidatus Ruania gallistercoris]|uniref:Class A beta-lactamase-related serine hydrolase n=1 Tax=Candidatus Ruania gallistercoris TaxID=2838746 RepID=A0A9D2ECM6_9MICO|nr:class A beta-lactamase-related serine hydrolase [Candidatus Ruania gallistercoris]